MMGSGKTTVGRLLARRLGVGFWDLDDEIAARDAGGRSCAEVLRQEGEVAFRAREVEALIAWRERGERGVLATGGGVVTTEAGRRALTGGWADVIWLSLPPEVLAERLGAIGVGDRPLIEGGGGDIEGRVRELLARRAPLYAEVAKLEIYPAEHSAESTCDLLAAVLEEDA